MEDCLDVLSRWLSTRVVLHEVLPSAQQQVVVVSVDEEKQESNANATRTSSTTTTTTTTTITYPNPEWKEALRQGRQKLVVRRWLKTCRWWNLHRANANAPSTCNTTTTTTTTASSFMDVSAINDMAAWEIAGYRVARKALPGLVPRVLYCSVDDDDDDCDDDNVSDVNNNSSISNSRDCSLTLPWAVFEYRHFSSSSSNGDDDGGNDHDTMNGDLLSSNNYWLQSMVRVRMEFGFEEPHPRWGRVPVEQSLDYALMVLQQVVLPLHNYCRRRESKHPCCHSSMASSSNSCCNGFQHLCGYCKQRMMDNSNNSQEQEMGYTFHNLLQIYKSAHDQMKKQNQQLRQVQKSVVVDSGDARDNSNNYSNDCSDETTTQLSQAIARLGQAICVLEQEAAVHNIQPLMPPVLCHMDYQPQNLQFSQHDHFKIVSVFDWEEAAFADPRFDLLLLCRKVCANLTQAQVVWDTYNKHLQYQQHKTTDFLGPLAPWLRLETTHSLTTMLLQAMNLQGGGRSPWESQPDLWGKIEREFCRLDQWSTTTPTT